MILQLKTLYNQAFGLNLFRYPKFDTEQKVPLPEFADATALDIYSQSLNKDSYEMKSIFGTPLFMPCKIDDFWLPNEPLITLTSGKEIVKTVVAGLKGTIKEEIASKDYIITIRGIIVNTENDDYPEYEVGKLRTICEKKDSKKVVSKLFRIFGIDEIAIENYNIFGIAGHQSQQAYQIDALSDRPVELIIKEGL